MTQVRFFCTGFGKFKGVDKNPTSDLVTDLLECHVTDGHTSPSSICSAHCLEVSTAAVAATLPAIVADAESRCADDCVCILLHFGVAAGNKSVDLEVQGVNDATFRVPDEQGFQPKGEAVEAGAPEMLVTALPTALLVSRMQARGHAICRQSGDAGRFLCNYIYAKSLAHCCWSKPPARTPHGWPQMMSLFVHVPGHEVLDRPGLKSFALDLMSTITEVIQGQAYDAAVAEARRIQEARPDLWTERGTTAAKSADFSAATAAGGAAAAAATAAEACKAAPVAALMPTPTAAAALTTAASAGPSTAAAAVGQAEVRASLLALGFEPAMVEAALAALASATGAADGGGGGGSSVDDEVSRAVAWIIEQEEAQQQPQGRAAPAPSAAAGSGAGGSAAGQAQPAAASTTSSASASSTRPPGSRYKLAIVVRSDLHMGPGKIAAQACHAALKAVKQGRATGLERQMLISAWQDHGEPIVVLKCDDLATLEMLEETAGAIGVHAARVRDAGRTQVAPGTVTVLAVGPAEDSIVDAVTGSLKLL